MTKIKSLTDIPAIAAYLSRIGAEPRSLRAAVIKETYGSYWRDVSIIKFDPDGDISAPSEYAPTSSEAARIKEECRGYTWPRAKLLGKSYKRPEYLREKPEDNIFEFRNTSGQLIMLQYRMDLKQEGDKIYQPWTFFDDDEWRSTEPDGLLPLWGAEHIKDNTTAFIHEGAKAARAMQRLISDTTAAGKKRLAQHPWSEEIQNAVHLGWIGGALNPSRTHWGILADAGIKRVYIVADNDSPGKRAIPEISRRLKGMAVFSIEFNESFPTSFDMADPWPSKFFVNSPYGTLYNGPTFHELLNPATWATDMVPQKDEEGKSKKGHPYAVLRPEFRDMWAWIEESDLFVCKEIPSILRAMPIFNGMVSAFSHVQDTAALVKKSYQGRSVRLAYRPDINARMISDGEVSAINLHTPTQIKSVKGDIKPFMEFMEYLIPDKDDRQHLLRWCATLIARPDIRMTFAVLLVSKQQGIGKSTLAEKILAPLVGMHNTSFPSERDIVEGNFNSWLARKRLVIVSEIYTGHSFKAYNNLKSYITDRRIDVNEKFMRGYTIDNYTHFVACSNSLKALKLEDEDRRWFLPKVKEYPWPHHKFVEFNNWINSGGLGIIKHWAHEYGDYVLPGEQPPMTDSKKELIYESKSETVKALMNWAESSGEDVFAVTSKMLLAWSKKDQRNSYDSEADLRKILKSKGWVDYKKRLRISGENTNVMMSPAMVNELSMQELSEEEELKWVRGRIRSMVLADDEMM